MSKIILSRKGFDSTYGLSPSPIIEDRLLPLPIPEADSGTYYRDLTGPLADTSLLDCMFDLGINQFSECHLDPDIYPSSIVPERPNHWKPSFGQSGSASKALINRHIGRGDIFLFFGWFKEAFIDSGKISWKANAPDLHCIWGYMKVHEVIENPQKRSDWAFHPHAGPRYQHAKSNRIYSSHVDDCGVFQFHPTLLLTDLQGRSGKVRRSFWRLPKIFEPYMNLNNTFQQRAYDGEFIKCQVTGRTSQELLIMSDPATTQWATDLIQSVPIQT
tara:strand:+ start:67 stop:885 length:819 start_codon:yes stop_codon:yes gene_type:complete